MSTGTPTGMWISFAVRAPCPGTRRPRTIARAVTPTASSRLAGDGDVFGSASTVKTNRRRARPPGRTTPAIDDERRSRRRSSDAGRASPIGGGAARRRAARRRSRTRSRSRPASPTTASRSCRRPAVGDRAVDWPPPQPARRRAMRTTGDDAAARLRADPLPSTPRVIALRRIDETWRGTGPASPSRATRAGSSAPSAPPAGRRRLRARPDRRGSLRARFVQDLTEMTGHEKSPELPGFSVSRANVGR